MSRDYPSIRHPSAEKKRKKNQSIKTRYLTRNLFTDKPVRLFVSNIFFRLRNHCSLSKVSDRNILLSFLLSSKKKKKLTTFYKHCQWLDLPQICAANLFHKQTVCAKFVACLIMDVFSTHPPAFILELEKKRNNKNGTAHISVISLHQFFLSRVTRPISHRIGRSVR